MANRVVLGAFGGTHLLRVSRPGFNVLATGLTPEQLAFDSRWSEAGNVMLSGTVATVYDPLNLDHKATVSFGVTLAAPPIIFLSYSPTTGVWVTNHPDRYSEIYARNNGFVARSLTSRTFRYKVYRNIYG